MRLTKCRPGGLPASPAHQNCERPVVYAASPDVQERLILDAAFHYARQGFRVLPLRPHAKEPLGRLVRHGVHDATDDPNTIRQWWSIASAANVGIACGAVSDIFVLDVDTRHGGDAELVRLETEFGELPDTVVVTTGRGDGGRHLYFAWPEFRVPNKAIRPGLDLRRDGGYAVAPPSLHPVTLKPYVGDIERRWIADGPIWLLNLLRGNVANSNVLKQKTTENRLIASVSLCLCSCLADAVKATLPTCEGHRNRAIFEFARHLKGMPQYADAAAADLVDAVREWHRQASPVIGTPSFDETWADFTYSWSRVVYPKGAGALQVALQRADSIPPPDCASRYCDERLRRLCALCRELQALAGDGAFYLACRSAGGLLHMDFTVAARFLRLLVHDHVLMVAGRHTPTKATRYRYVAGGGA